MTLKSDLDKYCADTFAASWTRRNGTVVPDTTDIKLGADGVDLQATVLYADLADSTIMVNRYKDWFAAEVYKSFLYCAGRIIRDWSGEITAYDGDRVMAVFLGDGRDHRAVCAALQINWAVGNVIQPRIKRIWPNTDFVLEHVCGIDRSNVLVARTGIRGNNDLVWVGRAANYAAKLSARDHSVATYITSDVYSNLSGNSLIGQSGENIWKSYNWTEHDGQIIYGSTYWQSFA